MTLAVWDGKTLAVDRCVTGTPYRLRERFSTARKLIVFDKKQPLYIQRSGLKSSVLAVTYAGRVDFFSHFHTCIFDSRSKDDRGVSATMRDYWKYNRDERSFSMLLLLSVEKKEGVKEIEAHTLHPKQRGVLINTRITEENPIVAIGSGKPFAESFSSLSGMDAVQLVKAASLFSPGVGNGVDYLEPLKGPEVHRTVTYSKRDRERFLKKLSHRVLTADIIKDK